MLPNIAVILTNASREIIWVNEDFTAITGYALNEVIGKKPSILQGPETEGEVVLRIRHALENAISIKECITNYTKTGRKYPCKLTIHPVFNSQDELTNFIAFEVDGDVVKNEEEIPLLQIEEKYKTSSLKRVEEVKLFFNLKKLMEEEALFLKPKLSLKDIADKLSTNTKYLSQVVNNQTSMNFQTFVNSYRVEAAQKLIQENKHRELTFYGIALQCGFKNKSTFYKVFKEITAITPKQFADQVSEANPD